MGGEEDPTASDYAKLLNSFKDRLDAPLLQTMLLRSLSQAVYSPDNAGHFGLSYEAYAHFTSPIRRYPDLLVHRAIKAILAGKKYKPATKWEALGVQCSMTERRADEASRDVQNWLKCYFMQDKVGEEFEGSVSAVTGFGMFVLLDKVFVEGLVHVSELGTDYFHYDEKRRELKGEHSGKVYRLTDRVKVKVARVDLETSKIDFVLVLDPKDTQLAGKPMSARGAANRGSRQGAKPVGRGAVSGGARTPSGSRAKVGVKTGAEGARTTAAEAGKPAGKPAGRRRRR